MVAKMISIKHFTWQTKLCKTEPSITKQIVHKQGRSQDFSKGGHTVPNIIVMAFSPRNIVGCLLKKGLQRGGSRAPRTPLATPLIKLHASLRNVQL